jgi:hypothetical protein
MSTGLSVEFAYKHECVWCCWAVLIWLIKAYEYLARSTFSLTQQCHGCVCNCSMTVKEQ